MAKLNQKTAKAVDKTDGGGFDPLPEGAYHVRLRDVDPTREGPAGPYWVWEYEVVEPGEYENRRLWTNTSLSEKAMFKLKETFSAYGVPTDTDTDELLGSVVKAMVGQRTIQQGERKGELTNEISKLLPADEDFEPSGSEGTAAEDIFA